MSLLRCERSVTPGLLISPPLISPPPNSLPPPFHRPACCGSTANGLLLCEPKRSCRSLLQMSLH